MWFCWIVLIFFLPILQLIKHEPILHYNIRTTYGTSFCSNFYSDQYKPIVYTFGGNWPYFILASFRYVHIC
jgi:hypothetical protein